MQSIRFNTYNIYKACNVLFFNELTGQSVRNVTKKLCKHLTSTKKTFNKMETKNQIIEAIIQRIKDEEKKHSKSIADWYRIAANKIYATFDIKIKEKMSNNKQCQFEASRQTSSATICKWCGREKWQHNTTMSNKQSSIIDMLKQDLDIEIKAGVKVIVNWDGYKAMERELIKESCIMAIMQWNEWDKTNYLDLYDHKVEGAEIWAEDYCKELYEEIEVPNPNFNNMKTKEKAEELIRKYNIATWIKLDEIKFLTKIPTAHECALIAVDEILNDDWYIATREDLIARKEYWNKVKQEIRKL